MTALRVVLGLAVLAVAVAVAGIAMGSAPKSPDPAPTGAALTASKQRIASGGGQVQEGKREFEARGCDACHAIAATGANGRLGPRLDTLADDKVADIVESITEPRKDIAPGYEADLMPVDYAKRMDAGEIKAIATYIKAASGSK
jgi:mono/diheme cytochrome c family protein